MTSKLLLTVGALALCLAGNGGVLAKKPKPPKGYMIAEVTVTDQEAFKPYALRAAQVIPACGGKTLAVGGRVEALEGDAPAPRFVIVEFVSLDKARECYNSPAYQAIVPIRKAASKSRFWLSEGLPQP